MLALTQPAAQTIIWRQTASVPITDVVLNDVKTWINRPLEDMYWDDETVTMIRTAQRAIEAHCQLALATSTWVGTTSRFYDVMRLIRRPFLDVEKIDYVDNATGSIITLNPDIYQVAPVGQMCGQITLGDGESWPDTARRMDAVRITAKTGFVGFDGVTPELPIEILHALKMTVSELDTARGDDGGTSGGRQTVFAMKQNRGGYLNNSIRDLLAPYSYVSVFAI
jgi:hypothetical protein